MGLPFFLDCDSKCFVGMVPAIYCDSSLYWRNNVLSGNGQCLIRSCIMVQGNRGESIYELDDKMEMRATIMLPGIPVLSAWLVVASSGSTC